MAEFRQDTTYEYSRSSNVVAVSQSQGVSVVGGSPLEGPSRVPRCPRLRSDTAPRGLALRGGERSEHPKKVFTYQVRREGPATGLLRSLSLREGLRKRSRSVHHCPFNLTLRDEIDGAKSPMKTVGTRYSRAKLKLSLSRIPILRPPSSRQARKGALLRSASPASGDRCKGSGPYGDLARERRGRRAACNEE